MFINEDIFCIDINYNIDEYSDKYNNIFINEIDTKFHMGLCSEKDCQNKSEPNEDICIQCFNKEKYETDNDEIYEMNLNKYSKIYMEDILNEFIMNKSKNIIENIINENNKFDIKNILTGYLKEDIIYDIIEDIKIKHNEKMIKYNTKSYKDDIFNRKILIFDKYIKLIEYPFYNLFNKKEEISKPDINVVTFKGKVDYLDIKIDVYKFPIKDNKIYNHIYNKYILYYKHVCNSDLKTRNIKPYNAYICYIEDGKINFETICFIKLFNILNLVYNKNSIINHIYDITYKQFNISNLIKN